MSRHRPETPPSGTPGRLYVPDEVARMIRALHPDIKRKVRSALRAILARPEEGKMLQAELAGMRSYRLGQLRIVYRLRDRSSELEIVAVGPRRTIYEETLRRVRP